MRSLFSLFAIRAVACLAMASGAAAQTWPSRPVTMVLPFPAGSGLEVTARIVADRLGAALGQPVIVDPRPGANGAIAASLVARAAPDGHTIFMTTNSTHSAAPGLVKNLPYDPIRDFTPLARIGNLPFLLVVNPKLPVTNFAELVAYAKANPGKLNYGSTNATGLVGMKTIARMTGVDMVHVPYKATPQALSDLISGEIQTMLVDIASGSAQMKAGTVRALAVTTKERSALLPDLPGTREAGLPDFGVNSWNGVFGPAGMPAPVAERLHAELRKIAENPEIRARLATIGFDAFSGTREEFAAFVQDELVQWTKWIRDAGIEPE